MKDFTLEVDEFLLIDTKLIEQAERDAAYRLRERQRNHHAGEQNKLPPYDEREFIVWDGEGPRDAGYALFGNRYREIQHAHLSTVECLDLIIQTDIEKPGRIHVIFGGNYDASMMLHDLSWRHLNALKTFNRTTWKDYDIEYVPRHWLRIRSRGRDIRIFDVVSFFATDLIGALRKHRIRTELCFHSRDRCFQACDCVCVLCHVEREKLRRSEFRLEDIEDIAIYMRHELELTTELMNQLRQTFLDAGFSPRSWHGPGALARMALNRHHIKDAMKECPPDVRIAARFAFAGGRFEMFRAGHFQRKVYNADINSAYPFFASKLPNLAKGRWRRTRSYEPGKFGLYNIQYHGETKNTLGRLLRPYPLFRRHASGHVEWPNRVDGWYWNPEAELVRYDPCATFVEGWVFDEDDPTDRPFAWIVDYFEKRQVLKRIGNAAEFTFKLIINSIYGQLAQRTGWDRKHRKSPKFHQLEWAGWITSACRAAVFKVATSCGNDLISIDTDGIYSLAPIRVSSCGDGLGQWDMTEYDEGIFWQSGIYSLRRGDTWLKAKTRGIPRGTYSPQAMINALHSVTSHGGIGLISMLRKSFTGFGLALNGQREKINTWQTEEVDFVFGGSGKRYHNERGCRNGTTCTGDIHGLIPVPRATRPNESCQSRPHFIPWLENDPLMSTVKNAEWDAVLYDVNDLDEDDRLILKKVAPDMLRAA